jgi:probable phosphoglycerate mutase
VEILLVRHGQPEWVREGRNVDDPVLTAVGQEQARRAAAALATERFDRVLVSPLVRARQTAAPIEAALGRPAEVVDWLAEIRNPEWDGTDHDTERIFAEARLRPAEQHWDGLPGGESFRDFHDRVVGGLRHMLADVGVRPATTTLPLWTVAQPDLRVLLVAHAGTNSVILTHLLGVQPVPWEWERFVLHHASISQAMPLPIGEGHSFSLLRLSDTSHLPAELTTR